MGRMTVRIVCSDGDLGTRPGKDSGGRERSQQLVDASVAIARLYPEMIALTAVEQRFASPKDVANDVASVVHHASKVSALDPQVGSHPAALSEVIGRTHTGVHTFSHVLCLDKPLAQKGVSSLRLPKEARA
jgi:hypothetical protein